MQLQGKYSVPEYIGVPVGTYNSAVAVLKDDTLALNEMSATVVFSLYSDDSLSEKLFDFVTAVEFPEPLELVHTKPSEEDVLGSIQMLCERAVQDMCPGMQIL